jgi:hypothetical protein
LKVVTIVITLRRVITKLKISSHRLKIETGRYLKLEVNKRLSNNCDLNQIEDEIHFLLECPSTSMDRQVLTDILIIPFIVYCVKIYVYKLNMRDKI